MLVETLREPGAVPQVLLQYEIVVGETLAPPNPVKDQKK